MICYDSIDFVSPSEQPLFEEALRKLEAILAEKISTLSAIIKDFYLTVYNFTPQTSGVMTRELFIQIVGTAISNRQYSVQKFAELVEEHRFEKGAPLVLDVTTGSS